MKATTKFYLKEDKNPFKPIFISVTFAGERIRYYSGYRIKKECFVETQTQSGIIQEIRKNSVGLFGKERVKYNEMNNIFDTIRKELRIFFFQTNDIPDRSQITEILDNILLKCSKPEKTESDIFWDMYQHFIDCPKHSPGRAKQLAASRNHLKNYEEYLHVDLTFDTINAKFLERWEAWLLKDATKSADKITRDARGKNTVISIMAKTRSFFRWAIQEIIKQNETTNESLSIPAYPFTNYKIKEAKYSDPIYLTRQERDLLIDFDSGSERLNKVRDMFVFQCLVGCRVGDLLRFKKQDIIDGYLIYIPIKTIKEDVNNVSVPLTEKAKEIISRYNDPEEYLFPPITDVKYNKYLKELFKKAGLNRIITKINPRTGAEEKKPLCDIISSHMARKTFIGSLYGSVKNEVICAMTGHKEGSEAFLRYRKVTDDMKMDAIEKLK